MNSPAFQPTTAFTPRTPRLHTAKCHRLAAPPRARVPARTTRPARTTPAMRTYEVEVVMKDGEEYLVEIDEEETLLEGMEGAGLEVRHSCRAGVCVTCAAKIVSGEIDFGAASITDDLKEDGYVLTCSGFPRSEGIRLEMNKFDDAYNAQYGQYELEDPTKK